MKLTAVINTIFYTIIFLVLILAVLPHVKLPNRIRVYAVASQSMVPTLLKGDLIVVKEETTYKEGDIITFSNPLGGKRTDTVTHRITKTEKEKDEIFFKTKGDANNAPDGWKLKQNLVLGKYVFKIPLIGSVITFSKTPLGLVLLIIFPGSMIAYSEAIKIKKEVVKKFTKHEKD